MLILFPHRPFAPTTVDAEFTAECEAARTVGFETAFYDHEALKVGNIKDALSHISKRSHRSPTILRGWMISGERYGAFYQGLMSKGLEPVTQPEAYEEAHYLPKAYRLIEDDTARSAWMEGDDVDAAWQLYQSFHENDAIIKDWVKSAKRRWKDGCFIAAGTTEDRFRDIYGVFRAERGTLFNRGVVLREIMPIIAHGHDIRGMPIVEETRLFFWKGRIVVDPIARVPSPLNERERWIKIAERFQSPFITIDVAYLTDLTWRIVEVGDGGVSGLPMGLGAERFYESLWSIVTKKSPEVTPS